jgi:hypothetical protein
MICSFSIDKKPYTIEIEGTFFEGKDMVLFSKKGNVIEHCEWLENGYTKEKIAKANEFSELKTNIERILLKILKEINIPFDDNFTLENYHHYVQTDAQHQSVIEKTRFLTFADFKIDTKNLIENISKSVGKKLEMTNPKLPEEIIIMRINRPSSLDINPFHRDGYLTIWENVLNVWIPIAGCTSESSLPIIPGSHYWNEKDIVRTEAKDASINGLKYHVPAIVSYKSGLHAIRPNPSYEEALIFTPFLVHGAALNKQLDTTRIALELRLYYNN